MFAGSSIIRLLTHGVLQFTSSELAEIPRMLGMFHALNSQVEDADDMFDEGITMLQNLERLLGEASPIVAAMNKDVFAGNMVADLLRESGMFFRPQLPHCIVEREIVWLCRQEQNGEDFMGALELLVDSSQSTLSKGLLHLLMGKLAMYSAHEYFSGSLCLSSLTESSESFTSLTTDLTDLFASDLAATWYEWSFAAHNSLHFESDGTSK
jgi:hypothetical protein